jgi:hypothetical protein
VNALGDTFAKLLVQCCHGHLGSIQWFRTDWQRGGALTGYSVWQDGLILHPVVVKLPVPPHERNWLLQLHHHDNVCPQVLAHGDELGGYDLAWVVMERLPHGPLGHHWQGGEFDLLLEAAGRFYAAARDVPLKGEHQQLDWRQLLERSREQVHRQHLPMAQRWSAALKRAHRKINQWMDIWNHRPIIDWCHGDLHLGNAMTRHPCPAGPALLLDFAQTRPGHWIEDAVYLEHLFWGRKDRLAGRRLCAQLAGQRHALCLPVDADWPRLATIKRHLLALSTPARLSYEGDPHHLHACLEVLEG